MSTTTTAATAPTRQWARSTATAGLALWGLLHVVGGASMVPMSGKEGLDTLAPTATTLAPDPAGDAAAALVHFHGLNIALAGVGVLVLALAWHRTRLQWQLWVAIGIATALDLGLLIFLVAPGLLPASQGLLGPGLLAMALTGYAAHQTRHRPLHA